VPTDPFVPAVLDEEPRQEPNLAPGSHMPPSGSWRADRPGDLGAIQPKGALLGNPGPNVGYALTLANRARDRLRLESGESADDALAIIAALAMKRSATFGRAPTVNDVDFAMELLGYQGDAPEDVRVWRPDVVREAAHDYVVRRAVVDTVGTGLLRLPISELPENLALVREAMARAAEEAAAADEGIDVDLGEPDDVDVDGDWNVNDAPDAAPDATADPA
jgi:hypothetical protein